MSRQLLFFDDLVGEDDDPEGWFGYESTSIDPGTNLFLGTAAFCVFTIFLLPCIVIWGNRYERKRMWRQQEYLENQAKNVTLEAAQADVEMLEIPGSVTSSASRPSKPLRRRGQRSDASGVNGRKGRSEGGSLLSNKTNTSSFIHGLGGHEIHGYGLQSTVSRFMDRLVIPPYQDDEDQSLLSQAYDVSSFDTASVFRHTQSNVSGVSYGPNFLDGRVSKRRKGKNAINRKRKIRKQVEQEKMLYPVSKQQISSREKWSDTKSDFGGIIGTSSGLHVEDDRSLAARSEMGMSVQHHRRNAHSRNLQERVRSRSPDRSVMSKMVDDITPNDAADANDPGQAQYEIDDELQICCGKNALWRPATLVRAFDGLVEIAEPDNEAKRIVRLCIPYTLGEVSEAIFEVIGMGIIGRVIGTESLSAYVVVEMLVGTSGEFIDGIIDSQSTVASHAIGAGNNYLAGQYVQISAILYTMALMPCAILWWFATYPVMLWLGFPESIALIAQKYARISMLCDLVEGLSDCYHSILEITDHEVFSALLDVVEGLIELMIFGAILMYRELTLIDMVWIQVFLDTFFMIFTVIISLKKGWMRPYWNGIFKNFALKNTAAVRNLLNTAGPLSFGNLVAYAEWEILTLFASHMGVPETVSWAILGTVWECFEAATEGIGDAGEVRVAYHLGKGNPEMAKISAYKSLLIGTVFDLLITSIFLVMGEDMPIWFTKDPTIQQMIADLIPLIALGNVTMSFGMFCWALIGAQNRYRLATLINLVCSWGITMPLAALFTYKFNWNLKGLTAAIVIGYAVAGMIMSYVILRSDWKRLSQIIVEINKITGEVDSSDSDSNEEDSVSSKSSSDSDDSDDTESVEKHFNKRR